MSCQSEARGAQNTDELPPAVSDENTLAPVGKAEGESHLDKKQRADDANQ